MTPLNPQGEHFVDRKEIIAGFRRMMTAADSMRVMWIHGPSGMGKTMLLAQLVGEAYSLDASPLHIVWRDTKRYGYLDLMRKLRDESQRPELFQLFHDKLNQLTNPTYNAQIKIDMGDISNVQILSNGVVTHSGVTVDIGHVIEDLKINVFLPNAQRDDASLRGELMQAFIPCFQALARERTQVIVLDGIEKADAVTMDWVKLLIEYIWEGQLSDTYLVVSTHDPIEDDPRFFDFLKLYQLQPFAAEDIREYLGRRGINEDDAKTIATFIVSNSNRSPMEVAKMTNNYIQMLRAQEPTT
jgi:hypothetical protein